MHVVASKVETQHHRNVFVESPYFRSLYTIMIAQNARTDQYTSVALVRRNHKRS